MLWDATVTDRAKFYPGPIQTNVRVFSRHGDYLHPGRQGEGPGELQAPEAIVREPAATCWWRTRPSSSTVSCAEAAVRIPRPPRSRRTRDACWSGTSDRSRDGSGAARISIGCLRPRYRVELRPPTYSPSLVYEICRETDGVRVERGLVVVAAELRTAMEHTTSRR